MNNKINKSKTIISVLFFAVLIAGAYFAYNLLSKNIGAQGNLLAAVEEPRAQNDKNDENDENAAESDKTIAPDFTVVDAGNNEIKLSEKFGKPIVLNFWASWCPPCKDEMPEFNKVYEEMGDDITFMMVDLVDSQRETKESGEQYIEEQGYTFPVYFDTKGEAGYIYGISSIPTTIFIDKSGNIITGARGSIDEETLRKGIDMIT